MSDDETRTKVIDLFAALSNAFLPRARGDKPNNESRPRPNGCEWCPSEDRPAMANDTHHRKSDAAFIVGANGQWRLCSLCVDLPRFRRFRVRRPIEPRNG